MTVTQQLSPSSLRALKSSRYANGQASKMMLEAKAAKRITSQFMSKTGAKEAAKRIRKLKKTAKDTGEAVDGMLKTTKGKNIVQKGVAAGKKFGALAFIAGLVVVLAGKVITDIQIQNIGFDNELRNESEFQKAFQRYQRNVIDIRSLTKQFNDFKKIIDRNNKDLDSVSKEIFPLKETYRKILKQNNDITYEVRQGRKIVEQKIEQAKKLGNDALYEARQNKLKLEQSVQQQLSALKSQFQNAINTTASNFQATFNNTIKGVQAELQSNKAVIENNNRSIDAKIKSTTDVLSSITKPIQSAIDALQKNVNTLQNNVNTVATNGVTVKVFEGTVKSLNDTYSKTFESQATQWNKEQEKLADEFLKLAKEGKATQKTIQDGIDYVDKRVNDFIKDVERNSYTGDLLKKDIDKIKQDINSTNNDSDKRIAAIETKIGDIEKMDKDANKKLDTLIPKIDSIIPTIAGIPLIAGNAANLIRPSIPTLPQIENATGTAICRSLNGGCGKKAVDDAVGRVNTNNNNNTGAVLDAVNAGLNTADLALLGVINDKLGDQVPNGLSGFLKRFSNWSVLNQVMQMMTFATTVHNAAMLSNDLGQTLLGIISNVLQFFGIRNSEGQAFNISDIIGRSIESFIRSVIGNDNYNAISEVWAKANRIYQASVNILNAFQGLASSILTGLEMTAGKVAKIGNALRKSGEVLETAYGWMNPQPKFNRITQTLESLQNGASTIQMVTQAPLDIINATTELTTATTELTNAIKEDDKEENKGKESPEPEKLKDDETKTKTASAGREITDLDLEADE